MRQFPLLVLLPLVLAACGQGKIHRATDPGVARQAERLIDHRENNFPPNQTDNPITDHIKCRATSDREPHCTGVTDTAFDGEFDDSWTVTVDKKSGRLTISPTSSHPKRP
jgi:hypothetical protein